MRYVIRILKYFLWFNILAGALIALMVFLGQTGWDGSVASIFRDGVKSLVQIECFFIVCSCAYPAWSFMNLKDCPSGKNDAEANKAAVKEYMAEHRFTLVSENGGELVYRFDSFAGRLARMFEDEIRFSVHDDFITISGLRKEVVRISSYLEYRLR